MTEPLLPPDPTKPGRYWLKHENGNVYLHQWNPEYQRWGEHGGYFSGKYMASDGYTLASPHPIPTAAQLDALHGLLGELEWKAKFVSRHPGNAVSEAGATAYTDAANLLRTVLKGDG